VPNVERDKPRTAPRIFAGILIGGASRRMQHPKALLPCGSRTFLERIARAVDPCVHQVVLLGDGPVPPSCARMMRLDDLRGVRGPLAGILSALRHEPAVAWLIIACDMPLIRPSAVRWLIKQRRPDRLAVVPRVTPDSVEPLFALYEPGIRPLLNRLRLRHRYSLQSLAGEQGVATPQPPPRLRACWTNVNTPEDYERLSQALRRG
jgi:molybdopterin-guanine dinucleotide biosynthesis protein A